MPSSGNFEKLVKIESHRLHIACEGVGFPVIVLETGIGVPSQNLLPLQQELAKTTRVCRYNRAGYSPSEIGPLPRSAAQEAEDLHILLAEAQLGPQYILVGHSLGALNLQVYAANYPQEVAGMVLMDPPPLDWLLGEKFPDLREMAMAQTAEWEKMADQAGQSQVEEDQETAVFLRTIASEHREMFGESAQLLVAIETFLDVPLIVIASGKANPQFGETAEEYQEFWIEQSRLVSQKSSRGEFILAGDCSHMIYEDNQPLVVEAVQSIIQAVNHP